MSEAARIECPLTDLVIARYLDGEADGIGEPAPVDDEVARHRRDCAACRRALERSRRLDALVAATRAPDPDAGRIDGWLAAALDAVPEQPGPAVVDLASDPARGSRWLVAAVAVVAVGVAALVGYQLGRTDGEAPSPEPAQVAGDERADAAGVDRADVEDRVATVPDPRAGAPGLGADGEAAAAPQVAAVEEPAPLPPGTILLSHRSLSELRRVRAKPVPEPSVEARVAALDAPWFDPAVVALEIAARLVDPASRRRPFDVAAAARALGIRRRFAADGFAAARADLDAALLARLAEGSDPARAAVAAACRDDRAAVDRLVRRIDVRTELEPTTLRALAAVRSRRLDAELAAWTGGDADRVARFAAALRRAPDHAGVGATLLALWSEAHRRGIAVDEALVAASGGHGPDVARDLAQLVESSHNAVDRQRALRLLGAIADPAVADTLIAVLCGPRREEAELAAWALGQLPAGADGLSIGDVDARRRALWYAALASRRQPSVGRVIDALAISPAERAFLRAGGFSPEQIPIAAALFRERSTRGDL